MVYTFPVLKRYKYENLQKQIFQTWLLLNYIGKKQMFSVFEIGNNTGSVYEDETKDDNYRSSLKHIKN